MRVLVVGAGLTGLVAAHRLRALGADVAVVEAAPRAGGVVETTRDGGWLLEHGPDAFPSSSPALAATLRESGLEHEVVHAPPLSRYVLRRGRLASLPRRPQDVLTTPALSPWARARLALEPLVPPREGEESVEAFVRRRLGPGAAALGDALVTGVVAGDPARVSLDETFPAIRDLERRHGSLFRALRAADGPAPSALATLRGGMQELVDALARDVRPQTDAPVESLVREGATWTATTPRGAFSGDRVVVALPPARAAKVVPGADWPTPREAPVAVVGLGFPEEAARVPQGYGYLAPESEHHFVLGAVFASRAFAGRAPEGHVLVRAMLGGVRHPDRAWMPPEDLVAGARRALAAVGLVRGEPTWSRVVRVTTGIPQPELGHARLRAAVRASEIANPGLRVVGWGYRGVSVEHCVREGRALADEMGQG